MNGIMLIVVELFIPIYSLIDIVFIRLWKMTTKAYVSKMLFSSELTILYSVDHSIVLTIVYSVDHSI